MTQNAPEQVSPITQEVVNAAEVAEQASLAASQNNYLLRRVVLLRAQLINALNEVEDLKRQVHDLTADEGKKEPSD